MPSHASNSPPTLDSDPFVIVLQELSMRLFELDGAREYMGRRTEKGE